MTFRSAIHLLVWVAVLGFEGLGPARAISLVTNPDFAADPNYVQPAGYQWPFNNAANWTAFDNGRAGSSTYGSLWDNAPALPDGASTVGFIQSIVQDTYGNSYPSGLSGIEQTISGLTSRMAYTISFYQNARLGSSTPQQDVDDESTAFVLHLEWPNGLDRINADPEATPTYAANYYLRTGIVQVSAAHRHSLDKMMRRTNAMHRAGLFGQDHAAILARSLDSAYNSYPASSSASIYYSQGTSSVQVEISGSAQDFAQMFEAAALTPNDVAWTPEIMLFQALQRLTSITFHNVAGNDHYAGLDALTLTDLDPGQIQSFPPSAPSPIAKPASAALLLVGAGLSLLLRRRPILLQE